MQIQSVSRVLALCGIKSPWRRVMTRQPEQSHLPFSTGTSMLMSWPWPTGEARSRVYLQLTHGIQSAPEDLLHAEGEDPQQTVVRYNVATWASGHRPTQSRGPGASAIPARSAGQGMSTSRALEPNIFFG